METKAQTFLDIGAGNNLLVWLLNRNGKVAISLDHNPAVAPDVLGLLPSLPFARDAFEVVTCFQVLEHLPFDLLEGCLYELARVSSKWVIISVPDQTEQMTWKAKIARCVWRTLRFPPRWKPRRRPADGTEHFWEIGQHDITADRIIQAAMGRGLAVAKHFRNDLFRYHHFFVFSL